MKILRIAFFAAAACFACSADLDCNNGNHQEPLDPDLPQRPTQIYPYQDSTNRSITPTFIWDGNFEPEKFEYYEYELTLVRYEAYDAVEWITLPVTRDTSLVYDGVLEPGTRYTWRVKTITDTGKERESIQPFRFYTGTGTNNPPGPVMFSPGHRTSYTAIPDTVPVNTPFLWEFLDPDGDQMTYELWYRTDSEILPTLESGLTDTEFTVGLLSDSHYYWNVIASDGQGGVDSSLVSLHFYTETTPAPEYLEPENGEPVAVQPVTLSWTCADPDGNPLVYDVYLGPANETLNEIASDIPEQHYELPLLDHETEYCWKVTAQDTEGRRFHGPVWTFTTDFDPDPGAEIYAELMIHRSQYISKGIPPDPDQIIRLDHVYARFDSVYAPDGPVYPRRPSAVSYNVGGDVPLEWVESSSRYYKDNPYNGWFLAPGYDYIFTVTPGDGVPALTKSIYYPECRPYLNSPDAFSNVSRDGFEVTWSGHDAYADCPAEIRLRIMDMGPMEWTDVDLTVPNTGSYTFTSGDLSGLDPMTYQIQVVLIIETKEYINTPGYDPRSWAWARTHSTLFLYLQQ